MSIFLQLDTGTCFCALLNSCRYKASTGKTYSAEEDPGVKSVQSIFNYYKRHGYNTIGESL